MYCNRKICLRLFWVQIWLCHLLPYSWPLFSCFLICEMGIVICILQTVWRLKDTWQTVGSLIIIPWPKFMETVRVVDYWVNFWRKCIRECYLNLQHVSYAKYALDTVYLTYEKPPWSLPESSGSYVDVALPSTLAEGVLQVGGPSWKFVFHAFQCSDAKPAWEFEQSILTNII